MCAVYKQPRLFPIHLSLNESIKIQVLITVNYKINKCNFTQWDHKNISQIPLCWLSVSPGGQWVEAVRIPRRQWPGGPAQQLEPGGGCAGESPDIMGPLAHLRISITTICRGSQRDSLRLCVGSGDIIVIKTQQVAFNTSGISVWNKTQQVWCGNLWFMALAIFCNLFHKLSIAFHPPSLPLWVSFFLALKLTILLLSGEWVGEEWSEKMLFLSLLPIFPRLLSLASRCLDPSLSRASLLAY